jgi:hypothetical protein
VTDAELDRSLAALGPIAPPVAVQASVLAAVGVSPARMAQALAQPEPPRVVPLPAPLPLAPRRPRARWPMLAAGMALAAGILFFTLPAPPTVGEPTAMVARGDGEIVPSLELRVAVRRGASVERLTMGQAYQAGDTLLFRVSAGAPMTLTLRRNDQVLFQGDVPAGDTDLRVGYTLEAGEPAARFVVEGGGARSTVELPGVPR